MTHGNQGNRNAAKPPQERKAVIHIGITTTEQQAAWVRSTSAQAGISVSEIMRRLITNAMQEAQ
jgi:hypothetical protein